MPKFVRALPAVQWQPVLYYGALVLLFGFLLWWHLGTVPGNFSPTEEVAVLRSQHVHGIAVQPINAPFLLPLFGLLHVRPSVVSARLIATLVGLLTLSSFYWLVRAWHGQRAAVFGTLLFGTSAWFLHSARLGTPDVLLFGLLSLAACGLWFKRRGTALPVLLGLVLAAALLYVPGMVWFIVAGVVWQWKTIDRIFKRHLWMVTAGGALLLAIVAPLGLAIYHRPALAKLLAGLPMYGWPKPFDALRHIVEVPLQFFWRGPSWPEHWLGRLPILNALCLAMFFLGVYAYAKHVRLVRTQLMGVILVVGSVLAGLGGGVTTTVIVPFVFILVAAGVGLLLDRWFTVFPRNQIAQSVGLGLVGLAVAASAWNGYRHYFVAWPAAPQTRSVFSVPQAAISGTIRK
ncbi:MAG TPA: hypothetical protein VLF71_03695 [Candidatus Saccharimonadales bacterium]|nr:hypothetical protein [Candidatus Saccharimonadales bacterium]